MRARLLLFLLPILTSFQNSNVPFKPKEEFQIDLKFELKQRPINDRYHVDFNETWDARHKSNASMLPYLTVHVKFLKFSEAEKRVKGFNSADTPVCNKKAEEGLLVKLNLGFTDDVKDRIVPHEFNIYTVSSNKEDIYLTCRLEKTAPSWSMVRFVESFDPLVGLVSH
jgi:hypothetical protein